MNKKKQLNYLKVIVLYCILFISSVIIAGIVAAFFGVDIGGILTATCGVFGGQLLMTCLLKLVGINKKEVVRKDDDDDDEQDVG